MGAKECVKTKKPGSKRVSRRSEFFVTILAIFVLVGSLCFGIGLFIYKQNYPEPETSNTEPEQEDENLDSGTPQDPETTEKEIVLVDFQPAIDDWVKTINGNKSILIYDLNLDKPVGSYNLKENYNTASLYKLFVVYEGYKRISKGIWNGEDKAGSTGKTISKCLDLAIRESHSPCAETLWGMIGRDSLDNLMAKEWGITGSDISKLTSNVSDIALIMKRFYEHPDFDDVNLLTAMWDSFLNQPNTQYEWRQGLPRGFSKASVYNKVGWDYNAEKKYWNIYHDAAIVKFPMKDGTTRDFVVVVMTNKVDFKDIRKFGTMIENKFYEKMEI